VARKTLADVDLVLRRATEEFESISLVKYEMAKDVYDLQDADTKKVIDKIMDILGQYATGYTTNGDVPVTDEYMNYNLLYLAVEVVKDLAFVDIRIANFTFPESMCAVCGDEMPRRKKGGK